MEWTTVIICGSSLETDFLQEGYQHKYSYKQTIIDEVARIIQSRAEMYVKER